MLYNKITVKAEICTMENCQNKIYYINIQEIKLIAEYYGSVGYNRYQMKTQDQKIQTKSLATKLMEYKINILQISFANCSVILTTKKEIGLN